MIDGFVPPPKGGEEKTGKGGMMRPLLGYSTNKGSPVIVSNPWEWSGSSPQLENVEPNLRAALRSRPVSSPALNEYGKVRVNDREEGSIRQILIDRIGHIESLDYDDFESSVNQDEVDAASD